MAAKNKNPFPFNGLDLAYHMDRGEHFSFLKALGLELKDFTNEAEIDELGQKGIYPIFQRKFTSVEEAKYLDEERRAQAEEDGLDEARKGRGDTGVQTFGKHGASCVMSTRLTPWLLNNGFVPITFIRERKPERYTHGEAKAINSPIKRKIAGIRKNLIESENAQRIRARINDQSKEPMPIEDVLAEAGLLDDVTRHVLDGLKRELVSKGDIKHGDDGVTVEWKYCKRIRWVFWNDENDRPGEELQLANKICIITGDSMENAELAVKTIKKLEEFHKTCAFGHGHVWENPNGSCTVNYTHTVKHNPKFFEIIALEKNGTFMGENVVLINGTEWKEDEAILTLGAKVVERDGEVLRKLPPRQINKKHPDYRPTPMLLHDSLNKLIKDGDTPPPNAAD